MQFYYIPNSYSAQIEGAGLNFRFGYTCFGVAPKQSFWQRSMIDLPKWYRLLFGWSFSFFCHAEAGRRYIFKIEIGALQIWYKVKGKGEKDEYTGFHIAFHGLKSWRLLL